MELKDIDIENIDLQSIESEISNRKARIIKEKDGYIRCLDITETLKFYVDDDFKEEARLISARIKFLKLQNAHTALFIQTVRDIYAKRLDESAGNKLFSIEEEAKLQTLKDKLLDEENALFLSSQEI